MPDDRYISVTVTFQETNRQFRDGRPYRQRCILSKHDLREYVANVWHLSKTGEWPKVSKIAVDA